MIDADGNNFIGYYLGMGATTERMKIIKFEGHYHGWTDNALISVAPDFIAAVITEPIMFNNGGIFPLPSFLERMHKICDETGTILIFDEFSNGKVLHGGTYNSQSVSMAATLATLMEVQMEFANRMLLQGSQILPRGARFLSSAHTHKDIDKTLGHVNSVLATF